MKIRLMILAASAFVIPSMAQTNELRGEHGDRSRQEWNRGENGGRNVIDRYREISTEEKTERDVRRLQIMEKTLKEIGVTDEQRQQIIVMQLKHKEQMKVASQKVDATRKKLSELEKAGGSQEELYGAIDSISDAQGEQMKILIRNKMQMERILGKEKYKQFMDAARNSYRMHGRRGGSGMPSRASLPPLPGQENNQDLPPIPSIDSGSTALPPLPND